MKLYGSLLSPFVRKAAVVLELKGLRYENIPFMPVNPDIQYLRISPLGKIPALEDGDLAISDSSVICEYLEERYPAVATMPSDIAQRARARWFEEYSDSKLAELCVGGIFYQRIVKPVLLQQQTNQLKVDQTINELLPPAQNYLESQLPSEGFLFGKISRADISIVSFFINAEYADYRVDQDQWPRLSALIDSVKQHKVIAKLLETEQLALQNLI